MMIESWCDGTSQFTRPTRAYHARTPITCFAHGTRSAALTATFPMAAVPQTHLTV